MKETQKLKQAKSEQEKVCLKFLSHPPQRFIFIVGVKVKVKNKIKS